MPKISELPAASPLTGDETISIVQSGITVKAHLNAALAVNSVVSISNPRWVSTSIPSSQSTLPINDRNLDIMSNSGGGC